MQTLYFHLPPLLLALFILFSGVQSQQVPLKAAVSSETKDPGRKLIFLFDGTGNGLDDSRPTNVDRFRELLYNDSQSASEQVVKYYTGIGTYRPSGVSHVIPFYSKGLQLMDQGVAVYFPDHVMNAYKELCETYKPGDKISIFGFSRGAYTARAVAAVVSHFGILRKQDLETDIPSFMGRNVAKVVDSLRRSKRTRGALEAVFETYFNLEPFDRRRHSIEAYNKSKREFLHNAATFRDTYSTKPVEIDFLGVWDCVNSVGVLRARGAWFTSFNPYVKVFRHAVSLDERRSKFDRSMWEHKNESEMAKIMPGRIDSTDVEQVWFAGSHSDVGGGSVQIERGTGKCKFFIHCAAPVDFISVSANDRTSSLANISLRWMIMECFRTGSGIIFNTMQLKQTGLLPQESPLLESPGLVVWASQSNLAKYITSENIKENDLDTLAEIHDQLKNSWLKPSRWGWSALEWMRVKKWDPDNSEVTYKRNKGQGRKIQYRNPSAQHGIACAQSSKNGKIKIHQSVKTRMESDKKYVPAARLVLDSGEKDISVECPEVEWVQ
ncbi:hypothetical protein K435DRAFT_856204 [Dendrothele bispora CBS 962.96]|uniref:T6SS Phospholipase effector Tle1-like catalytic domain-containing protein n=1 Tax=Dendrothele bispora (strain CBS 962.96) TaxID=1314807 RepID=A0A4S8M905_DENBC|nr:hypothetical protein K435DRAFT_856204 [Dendrothele bispora CBS 962.96]